VAESILTSFISSPRCDPGRAPGLLPESRHWILFAAELKKTSFMYSVKYRQHIHLWLPCRKDLATPFMQEEYISKNRSCTRQRSLWPGFCKIFFSQPGTNWPHIFPGQPFFLGKALWKWWYCVALFNWLGVENYDKIKINLINNHEWPRPGKRVRVSYESLRFKSSYRLCI